MFSQVCTIVKEILREADSAHDWEHITRVLKTSNELAKEHGAHPLLTKLVAVLHEVGDPKLPKSASIREILTQCEYDDDIITGVEHIVPVISFTSSLGQSTCTLTKEEQAVCDCVSDADKLDALGAIGIARTLAFTGSVKRPIYKLDDKPRLNYTPEEYKNTGGSTTAINHFFEKLFRLDKCMKTKAGKDEANKRIKFMREYLNVFAEETGLSYPLEA
jgi:uncharacterized protein